MDGFHADMKTGRKTVAFLTPEQTAAYGGYVDASRILKVDTIWPPCFLDDYWDDMAGTYYPSIGHA